MKKYIIVFFIFLSIYAVIGHAQPSLILMTLSAHPDDEDGAALAYYGQLKGVKTYSVFYTRGEGGQNEIGSALGEELGILRAKETREAGKILGNDVIFLGFPDFGFSKTAKETFTIWGGHDSVLARIVYVIRALKPDILITNHDTVTTKPNRQHGNHQAVGITAYEAFQKAADASYHPEQLHDNISLWQVKKLFYRYFNRGSAPRESLVTIDVTQRVQNGKTVEQVSLDALSKHRSQGMDKLSLDSIPSFFRKHMYYQMRSDGAYPFDSTELFSGLMPQERASLQAEKISFNQVLLPKTQVNNPKNISPKLEKNIHIGLVATYDSTLQQTLQSFNVNYKLIDSSKLASGDLSTFTTILLDLRTYEYRTDAVRYNAILLSYINNGGNIVCFYHKTGDWNGKNFSPYPLMLTNERVTEEDAKVTLLNPNHALFTLPNTITENDWGGWVQERNIYLPSDDTLKTSAQYERLLLMSDTDERQPSTSLLYAQYGKGSYTYVSLALYRQLRNFNEGAIKLLFNMISQVKGK